MDRDLARRLRHGTYYGQDLVPTPRRLALMNLYLHGLEPEIALGDSIYEAPGGRRFDVVLTNPPFGTRGANQAPNRDDFTVATSNKQLNFLQHVKTLVRPEAGRPSSSRTTSSSREGLARRCADGSYANATYTRCCGSLPGSSMRRG